MPSDRTALTTLATDLRRLGLNRTADELNDRIAEATRKRWSATVLLEHLVADELEDKQRRSVESRLTRARLGRFKPLADWNWEWPTALDRLALERILTLDFLARGENVILVGAQGLGKTMLAKNIAHQAVLAGHSALFTTAADLLLNLNGQETGRALERRLRHYTRPTLLVIDELGYLAYDARAADLIFQLVSRRYEHRSLLITTNLPFKRWDTVFPNASCAVALIDRRVACGKTTCRCHRDPDARHGPYHYWTRKARGKTVGMHLTEDEVVLYQEWIENNRELERIVTEMRDISSRVLALITGREVP